MVAAKADTGPYFEDVFTPACSGNTPDGGADVMCMGATVGCPQNSVPGQAPAGFIRMLHFQREVDAAGKPLPGAGWNNLGAQCMGPNDPALAAAAAGPTLPQLVIRAWQSVPIAKNTAVVQPAGTTLVNLPAIFSTKAAAQDFPLTILEHSVVLHAVPVEYRWHFGDGTTTTTTGPGAPYPSKDITHDYPRRGDYRVSVDVLFRGEFTVDGGADQPLPGQTTVIGPTTPLAVVPATTRLVDR